jgi:hypothetical protein
VALDDILATAWDWHHRHTLNSQTDLPPHRSPKSL